MVDKSNVIKKSKDAFDYTQCKYECRIQKKKVLYNSVKYVYILENQLVICNEPYKKFPDKIIDLVPEMKIQWVYNKTKNPVKIQGFVLQFGNEEIEYTADELVLTKLKEIFMLKIFQSRFQEEYEVLAQIGKGNYARVFSCRHRLTGKKYAVKCFEKLKLQQLEKGLLSLFNELKIMRALTENPNVIKLHETFEGENTYYFVMEIVEGTSLYDEIKKHSSSPYTDEETMELTQMLLQGIQYCACKNIMHRDIKPENILFLKKGNHMELKIVDFGLATFANDDPYIFPKCGTPGFVAPEIANLVDKSQPYDVVCDIFSVGVIFHILLTGEAVFPGKKFNEVLKKNKACEINLSGSQYEFLSPNSKDLLAKMLEKDPKKRIRANDALKHPYFTASKNIKKVPSYENLVVEEENDNLRPKQASLFTKPLRIPYLSKENTVDPNSEDLNSFVTKDPLFGSGQKGQQQDMRNRQDSGSLFYNLGSGENKDKDDIKKKSTFAGQGNFVNETNKDFIMEENENDEADQNRNKDRMEEEKI